MKLDTDSLNYVKNVVETGQMIGIDNVIIETDRVRAINDEKSVVMFQEENVPDLGFNVGLNRIGVFLNRLEVARTQENFSVAVKTDDNQEFARSFTMTGKGFKDFLRVGDSFFQKRDIRYRVFFQIHLAVY